jgi:hypothetical protein
MQCNKSGCKQTFHVTCAQGAGLLCEEAGNYQDNVKYCGYCDYHYQRINKKVIKTIPAYKPIPINSPDTSPEKKVSGAVITETGGPAAAGAVAAAAPVTSVRAGSEPGSPSSSSNDARKISGKKGRRPNSAASDSNDGKKQLDHNSENSKLMLADVPSDSTNVEMTSPTSANSSSVVNTSSSSSSS